MDRRAFLTAASSTAVATALPALPLRAATPDEPVRLRDFYNKDKSFSDLALSLQGQRIGVEGFMAPPLKADASFFVLTKMPMAVCPFCESSADWPDDILAVYTKRTLQPVPFNVDLVTRGVLEMGEYRDPDTGFVSLLRLTDATYERA